MAEWTKAPVLRTGGTYVPQGFESLPRRLVFKDCDVFCSERRRDHTVKGESSKDIVFEISFL